MSRCDELQKPLGNSSRVSPSSPHSPNSLQFFLPDEEQVLRSAGTPGGTRSSSAMEFRNTYLVSPALGMPEDRRGGSAMGMENAARSSPKLRTGVRASGLQMILGQ